MTINLLINLLLKLIFVHEDKLSTPVAESSKYEKKINQPKKHPRSIYSILQTEQAIIALDSFHIVVMPDSVAVACACFCFYQQYIFYT